MTIEVKPIFESAVADDPTAAAAGHVTPTRWNAGHKITMVTARLLGRTTADPGDAEEIEVTDGLSFTGGVLKIVKATAANIRARLSNSVLTSDNIAGAKAGVALAYSATRSLVWTDGWYRTCTLTGNMTLSNPTSVEEGDTIVLRLVGSDATERSVSFGSNYKGPLPEDTVTSTKALIVTLFAASTTEIHVTWKAATL